MKPSEDELISQIKKTMASHEEPYVAGAWEKFNERAADDKKPVFGLYKILSIAAMLLVCAFVFLYVDKVVDNPKTEVAKKKTTPAEQQNPDIALPELSEEPIKIPELERSIYTAKSKSASEVMDSLIDNSLEQAYVYQAIDSAAILQQSAILMAPDQDNQLQNLAATRRLQLSRGLSLHTKIAPPTIAALAGEQQQTEGARNFESFLEKEQLLTTAKLKSAESPAKQQQDKWELGLMVAPSFGNNNKLNFGYGVSMAYALSRKVEVVSGITYNDMHASNQVPSAPVNTAAFFSGESKNLQSVEASVSGIDIPLGIKYNLSKKIYANVGVSAFAVLNERKNNTYIQETSMQTVSTDPGTAGEMRIVVMNQRVTEKAPDPSVGDKYIGFYNLSFGVKQPLSKKNTLSLEPFVKLPMKETAGDNLRLIGTGIKLKLDF